MEKLESILEAAANRFAHYGFRRTSIDDIARDVGIAKGSIYLHVENKEILFYRTIERERQLWLQSNETAIRNADDPKKAIFALVYDTLQWLERRPLIGRLMVGDPELGITQEMMNLCMHGRADDGNALPCTEMANRKIALIADTLAAGIRDGLFRPDLQIETTVTMIVSIFHIHLHNQRMRFIQQNMEDYVTEALRILFEGIQICREGFSGNPNHEGERT